MIRFFFPRESQLMSPSVEAGPLPRPLSPPPRQVSVSLQILQVFHQSGQLSVSNPCSEWEKQTELTL